MLVARDYMVYVDLDERIPDDSAMAAGGVGKRSRAGVRFGPRGKAAPASAATSGSGSGAGAGAGNGKGGSADSGSAKLPNNFRFVERYGPIVEAQFVGPDEMVVVETPWLHAVKHLPDPVERKRFGT